MSLRQKASTALGQINIFTVLKHNVLQWVSQDDLSVNPHSANATCMIWERLLDSLNLSFLNWEVVTILLTAQGCCKEPKQWCL